MSNRVKWSLLSAVMVVLAACFTAGDISIFEWPAVGRFGMIIAMFFAFITTITCPFIKEGSQ